ncbi:hypothetical protein ELP57_36785, partial [Klebsiella pneumoniae]|nr:hypothetical protein [Klebsiella pneumoniae]
LASSAASDVYKRQLQLDVRGLVVSASSDAAMLERGEKKPPRGVRGGKSACGSGRKKPRRRSGRKTARPDVQLGHFSRIFRLIRCCLLYTSP